MSRLAYVNGRYRPFAAATVHIEDRGFQFADGVYEVCYVVDGCLIDEERHWDRLDRSLREIRIAWPVTRAALGVVVRETVSRNRVTHGLAYVQVTRGRARRDHAFPDPSVAPSLIVTARSLDRARSAARAASGIRIITVPETRWARRDIKSIALLPNVLAKQAAREAGAYEAWFVEDGGVVTEGASTNAWIVTSNGVLVTPPRSTRILWGVTRSVVLDVAEKLGLTFEERSFTVTEAHSAKEAFITAASALVMPVISIDGVPVGTGSPGPVAIALRQAYPL